LSRDLPATPSSPPAAAAAAADGMPSTHPESISSLLRRAIPSTAHTVPALMDISSVPPRSSVFQASTASPRRRSYLSTPGRSICGTRHAVRSSREGRQEADVVELAHPRMPPPPQWRWRPSAAHRSATAICARLWKCTTDVGAAPLAASHPREGVTPGASSRRNYESRGKCYKGIGAAVRLGNHAQGAAVVAPQQAIAELVQQRAPDLHVQEVVVAAARGRGAAPLPRWRREGRPQQGAQPRRRQGG
jgi:hypothetical protein